jgi:CAAD domains of cyanobacterial aminoacyl-tRNA synthetase
VHLLLQLPKLLELVGLGYSAWFTYRYLLFKVRPQLLAQTCTPSRPALPIQHHTNLCRVLLAMCPAPPLPTDTLLGACVKSDLTLWFLNACSRAGRSSSRTSRS